MTFEKLRLDQPFHLQVMENGNLVFEHTFLEAPITIGRSVSCSVPLTKYNWISRQHFQVAMVDGRWVATDLNSANGMMYNGQAHSQLVLESGMVLEVGPLQFRFEFSTLHQKPEAQTLRSHESAYPTLNNAVKPHVPPAVHAPRAAFAPPRPVNFRNVRGLKLSPAWFEKSPEHSRILKRESGCAALSLNTISPQVARAPAQTRVFEVFLTWKDQVYDSRLYFAGDNISIGTDTDDLYAPNLKGSFLLGRFDGQHADIYLSKGAMGTVYRGNQRQNTLEQLLTGELIPRRGKGYSLSLSPSDRCEIELGSNLKLHARYATAPRQLSKTLAREPDHLMRKSLTYSGSVHLAFLLFALLMAPAQTIPKVKHLPPRVAKLLTPKEAPVETPKPKEAAPPPEPLKQAKEEPPKKRIEPKRPRPQPKKVVIRTNEKMKVINRLPKVAIQKTVDAAKPPPDIRQLGALAALGALGTPTVSDTKNLPVAINVNANAGGQTSLSTTGVIGALKAKGGKLAAGGSPGVKTTGKGFGSGSEYGVQGLKGVAGNRGIAAAVIGSPKLMTIDRTEGLTQKQVMDVVKQHVGKIQQCYERSLLSKPNLAGRVEYEWEISPVGLVKWIKVKRSDLSEADILNNCISAIFRKMKFPVASNGETTKPTIGFPFGRL